MDIRRTKNNTTSRDLPENWIQKKKSPLLRLRADLKKTTSGHRRTRSKNNSFKKNSSQSGIIASMSPNSPEMIRRDPSSFPSLKGSPVQTQNQTHTDSSRFLKLRQTRTLADLYDLEFREGDLSRVQNWLEDGGDISHRFSQGRTLLHYAVCMPLDQETEPGKQKSRNSSHQLSLVKWLIEMGIRVNEQEKVQGESALHMAARLNLIGVVSYLVKTAKADPLVIDRHSLTPFHSACAYGNTEVATFLFKGGYVDLALKDENGLTSYDMLFRGGMLNLLPDAIQQKYGGLKQNIAASFVSEGSTFVSAHSLSNVNVISVEQFIEQGLIPCYTECYELGILVPASALKKKSRILFILHRWESCTYPDPHSRQFKLILKFLQEHEIFSHVFISFSCISQDEHDDSSFDHLWNIPTAIFQCDSVLVIPDLAIGDDGMFLCCSDLIEFTTRAWFQLEALLAVLSGCTMYIAFQAPPKHAFQKPWWCAVECWAQVAKGTQMLSYFHKISEVSENMFQNACSEALSHFINRKADGAKVTETYFQMLKKIWCSGQSPRELTSTLELGVKGMTGSSEFIFEKIKKMSLQPADISLVTPDIVRRYKKLSNAENTTEKPHSLHDAYQNMGDVSLERDRVIILRCLLISFAFFMGQLK